MVKMLQIFNYVYLITIKFFSSLIKVRSKALVRIIAKSFCLCLCSNFKAIKQCLRKILIIGQNQKIVINS